MHPFFWYAGISALATAAVLIGLVLLFLYASNELYSLDRVSKSEEDILWGPAFSQFDYEYKLKRARHLRPQILALGSSRANQFRAEMFPGASFYTAAGAAFGFENAYHFLDELYAVHHPSLLILTIDPWWLRPVEDGRGGDADFAPERYSLKKVVGAAVRHMTDPTFLSSVVNGAGSAKADPFSGRPAVGYRAAWFGDGYRPDGSHQYGRIFSDRDPYYDLSGYGYRNGFRYYIEAIRKHTGRFKYTGELVGERLQQLVAILKLNRRMEVPTILLLPPFPSKVYAAIQETSAQRDFFMRFEAALLQVARDYDVKLYNFHDLSSLHVSDEQTIDDLHADEIAYAAMVNALARRSRHLAGLIRTEELMALTARMADPGNRPGFHLIAR